MVTGRRAFQRDSSVQTLSAIIEKEPESIAAIVPGIPVHLRVIVERCLAKYPEERYDSTRDLARELGSVELTPQPRSKELSSLVVLPLANLSADPEQEYFSDGMTEALITDLAKIGSLKVISRTSAMHYKKTDKTLPEIARELKVDAVVEGSVLRAGNRVRITAQLIQADTDEHLWAESYEKDLEDILSLQSDVARAISREIRIRLTPEEERRLATVRTVIPEAHEAYLMGRHHWNKFTAKGFQNAVESFEKAIEIDPSYTPAHSGLADSFMAAAFWGFIHPRDVIPQAKAAALRAVDLDDTLSEAHASLAAIRFWFDLDWGAGRDFEKAIELNPGNALARYWYGVYLGVMGQTDERLVQVERATELDPLSPIINFGHAWGMRILGRYDESITHCKKILELQSDFLPAYLGLAWCYTAKDQHEEWLESTKKLWDLLGHSDVAEALEKRYLKSGAREASLAAGEKASELRGTRYVPPYYIAFLYHDAGEWDKCIDWLEKVLEERCGIYLSMVWDKPIQSHPRFQALLRRMNLPK
jgi:TolB-like protein/Tfp pilus assembly protein PilF